MSDKLYYSDGYLRETEATVISVSDRGIKLDRTVFYPEAGGQPGDRGFFGDFRIFVIGALDGRLAFLARRRLFPGQTGDDTAHEL